MMLIIGSSRRFMWKTTQFVVFQPKAEGGGFPVGSGEGPVGNRAVCGFPWEGLHFPWEIRARAWNAEPLFAALT